jgi:hypothetical protein
MNSRSGIVCLSLAAVLAVTAGCESSQRRGGLKRDQVVQRVLCLYDQKPWINNDTKGDRDPEGVRFRAYLKAGQGKSVVRDGTFQIDIYRFTFLADGTYDRSLIGDYRYPSDKFSRIDGGLLGPGYLIQLNWGPKDTPGHEIEIVTTFEDEFGNVARGETKRLRVPKFAS